MERDELSKISYVVDVEIRVRSFEVKGTWDCFKYATSLLLLGVERFLLITLHVALTKPVITIEFAPSLAIPS